MALFYCFTSIFSIQVFGFVSISDADLCLEEEAMKKNVVHRAHFLCEGLESRQSSSVVEVGCCANKAPTSYSIDFVDDLSQIVFHKWVEVAQFTTEPICKKSSVEEQDCATQVMVFGFFYDSPCASGTTSAHNISFVGGRSHSVFLVNAQHSSVNSLLKLSTAPLSVARKQPLVEGSTQLNEKALGQPCLKIQLKKQPESSFKKTSNITPRRLNSQEGEGGKNSLPTPLIDMAGLQSDLYNTPLVVFLTWLFSLFHNILVIDWFRPRRYVLKSL